MTAALHQLRIDYLRAEDRLMLKISTHDKAEMRLWLTRRLTKGLWAGLVKMVEANASVRQAIDADTKQAVIAFQHEHAIRPEQFAKKFEDTATEFPMGEEPALVIGLKIGSTKGEPTRLSFQTENAKAISIGLDDRILHSLVRLLTQVMPATGWDLDTSFAGDDAGKSKSPAQVH